jgi:hypothetical protein
MKILKTSPAIRTEITKLMSPGSSRRVAIAAFVGDGARAFIRKPNGVEIVCWPKAGGTNPLELRRLKKAGARIRFADRLHMKVYWAANRGALITSANLSTNALGIGNLKEFGVFIPETSFDIDELLESLKSRPFNSTDMKKLEVEHRKLVARLPQRRTKGEKVYYLEWFRSPARSEWKLGWIDDVCELALSAARVLETDFNLRTPEDFIQCKGNEYKEGDWILSFKLNKKGASSPRWLYVDFIAKVNRKDEKAFSEGYPYQAIQVWAPKHYSPPFAFTPSFKSAFRKASLAFGVAKIKQLRSVRPPVRLITMIGKKIERSD